jgi:hypothetical protein
VDLAPALASPGGRTLFVFVALLFLAWLWQRGRPRAVLGAVLVAGAFVWAASTLPLARPYAAGPSHDRLGNLALAQAVAAGNPLWQSAQPAHFSFEPFWGVFAATLSGFSPERLLAMYDSLPLIAILGVPVSWWWLLRRIEPWERAVVVAFVGLLWTSPLDFHGTYRAPWAMTFLLKPNHALGLVLLPIVLDRFVAIRTWRDRLVAGAWLHLLAWVFVLHMAYTAMGLALFALLSWCCRRLEARGDVADAAIAIGINALIASPYLLILLFTYPFLEPGGARMAIPVDSAHLLEVTFRVGAPFLLAVWGGVVLARRGDRLSRVLWAEAAAALAFWGFNLVLGHFQYARERDEIYYWTRLFGALLGGFGAWDLASRCARLTGVPALSALIPVLTRERARAAVVLGLALPWSVPAFWDPPRMDRYFGPSLQPLPARITGPTDFLRRRTARHSVVVGDLEYSRWTAALGARRVLYAPFLNAPSDLQRRQEFAARLLRGEPIEGFAEAERRWGVTHLLVTPALLASHPGVHLEDLQQRADLDQVYLWRDGADFVAVFERSR